MSAADSTYESRAKQLARLSRPLHPVRPPFYVHHPTAEILLVGWYWIPTDATKPEPLGSNWITVVQTITRAVDAAAATKENADGN